MSVFVAPQIGTQLCKPSVMMSLFLCRSAEEAETLQVLRVACPRYQEHRNLGVLQISKCCCLWHRFCSLQMRYCCGFMDSLMQRSPQRNLFKRKWKNGIDSLCQTQWNHFFPISSQEIIKNKQCGYDVRKPGYVSIICLMYISVL